MRNLNWHWFVEFPVLGCVCVCVCGGGDAGAEVECTHYIIYFQSLEQSVFHCDEPGKGLKCICLDRDSCLSEKGEVNYRSLELYFRWRVLSAIPISKEKIVFLGVFYIKIKERNKRKHGTLMREKQKQQKKKKTTQKNQHAIGIRKQFRDSNDANSEHI